MHLLVPLDGSPLAESAIESAVTLLRRAAPPNSLTLLRVISPGSVAYNYTGMMPPVSESVFQAAVEGGREYLAGVVARCPLHGIRVETIAEMDTDTAADICQAAKDNAADLIVMTSHVRSGIAHFVLGSFAEGVLRQSAVPTLVVQGEGSSFPALDRDEPLTILVPLDGTPLAEAALAPAITLAAQVRGAIRLMRVLPAHTEASPTDRMLTSETHAYFAGLRARVVAQGVPMHETIAWGDVMERITAIAQANQTDLIALATHGRTGLARLRDGSVTLELFHRLSLPLLIVHPTPAVLDAPTPLSGAEHG